MKILFYAVSVRTLRNILNLSGDPPDHQLYALSFEARRKLAVVILAERIGVGN